MAEFKGYLIKLGDQEFPYEYIELESYVSTDNQRTELKAYRNANNLLIRQTSPNFKTKIEFNTRAGLWLEDIEKIKGIIDKALTNKIERKVKVTYWNNEDLIYKTMYAYIPDVEYTIYMITNNNIQYKSIRFSFIEY